MHQGRRLAVTAGATVLGLAAMGGVANADLGDALAPGADKAQDSASPRAAAKKPVKKAARKPVSKPARKSAAKAAPAKRPSLLGVNASLGYSPKTRTAHTSLDVNALGTSSGGGVRVGTKAEVNLGRKPSVKADTNVSAGAGGGTGLNVKSSVYAGNPNVRASVGANAGVGGASVGANTSVCVGTECAGGGEPPPGPGEPPPPGPGEPPPPGPGEPPPGGGPPGPPESPGPISPSPVLPQFPGMSSPVLPNFPRPAAAAPAAETSAGPDGLPFTGTHAGQLLLLGLSAVLVGGAAAAGTRRRTLRVEL